MSFVHEPNTLLVVDADCVSGDIRLSISINDATAAIRLDLTAARLLVDIMQTAIEVIENG